MGCYMRYIVCDHQDVSLKLLEAALQDIDPSYQIERDNELDDEGELTYKKWTVRTNRS